MRWALVGVALALGCGSVRAAASADGSDHDAGAGSGGATDAHAGGAASMHDAAADAGPSLPAVGTGHLQLWLTADRGVNCVAGEVTAWADQSGKNRPVVRGSHKGPQCAVLLHTLAGVGLPYFSAPGTVAPFDTETLDVDLSFLANTDFTIFVVEIRWADRGPNNGGDEWIIGTDLASANCPDAGDQISFGYVYYDGYPALDYESLCYRPFPGTRGRIPPVAVPPPAPAAYDMVRLEQATSTSPVVWQNGIKVNVGGSSGGPGTGFVGGSIGRAFTSAEEHRFEGDIAEIVIFDVALTDDEAAQMATYFKQHWGL
jgi:hypothetical protein